MDYFSNNHRDGGPVFDKPEFSNPADWMLDVTLGRVAPQQEEPENVAAFFPLNDAEAAAEALSRLWLARSREGREQFQPDVLERPADSRVLESLRSQRAFVVQFICFAKRAFLQHLQLPGRLYFDCALMSFFGALFGMQSKNVKVHKLPIAQLWIGIGLQLFLAVATLPVFGSERVVFWREAARGSGMSLNIAAYFLGKDILVTVVLCLVLTMLSGFGSQTLDKLNSAPGLRIVPWLSPVRWVGETLVVAQTRKLSFAWKMSPTVYRKPTRDSALALLFGYTFHEGTFHL
ncbi:hypothetical protein CTAYLR_010321 [Chrysophaeum taylorii]|uniref:ABC transporter family G domain-containing protein n=1 Tax=Chrysophaeum taylorii TaxID=2483200 RepID=A0AAD7UIS7_9STRA|nr:hypothetical protein CTAYLR_010321 [Chrysophaeum taylorii]